MSLEIGTVGKQTQATADTVVRRSSLFSRLFGGGQKSASTATAEPQFRIPPPHEAGEVIQLDIRSLRSWQGYVEGNMVGGQFKVHGQYSEEVNPSYGSASIPEVYWVDWKDEPPFWALREGNHRTVDAWSRGMTHIKAKVVDYPREQAEAAIGSSKPYIPFGDTQLWEGDDYIGKLGERFVLRSEIDGTLGERLASFAGGIQTKMEGQSTSEVAPGFEGILRRSTGSGLAPAVQQQMEGWLSADFSGVKIHTGEAANKAAEAINAKAFTIGKDVYFRRGAYDPSTSKGLALLGHELTHVAQNTGGAATIKRKDDQELTRDSWWARHTVGAYTIGRGLVSFYAGGGLEGLVDVPNEQIEDVYAALKTRKGVGPSDIFRAARVVTGSDEAALEAALGVALHHSHDLPYLPLKGIDPNAPMYDKYKHFFSCAVMSYRGNATGAEWVGWLKEQSDKYLGGGQYDPLDVVANDMGAQWASDLLKGRVIRVTDAPKPQKKGLIIGGHDRYEQQADANEQAIQQALSSGQLKPGGVNTATQGLVAALGGNLRVSRHQAVVATRGILRRAIASDPSGGTAVQLQQLADVINSGGGVATLRRKADVRRSPADNETGDAAIEEDILREANIPTGDAALSRWPFLRSIVDFFRNAFTGLSGTLSDLFVSLLPVIGNVYSVCCGLVGMQIIGWQPMGLLARILSFAGLIPIPGAGLAKKVGGFAQRIFGRGSWVRRATSFLAEQFNRYVPAVLSGVRSLWNRVLGLAGRVTGSATRFLRGQYDKVYGWITKTSTRATRVAQASDDFQRLFTGKLDELATASGRTTDDLLDEALRGAQDDMGTMLGEALPGYRFNRGVAGDAVRGGGHDLVEMTTREYNDTLGLVGENLSSGFRANFEHAARGPTSTLGSTTSEGLVNYGKLPWIAGGGAALADEGAIYSLRAGGVSGAFNDVVTLIGHANPVAVHEFGHVLQYAYFQKVFQRLGVSMNTSELRVVQTYLEAAQKPAMESMAYLFATPGIGNTTRQRLVGSFMDTASANLRAGNFGNWGLRMPALEAVRSSFVMGLSSGLMGVVIDTLCNNIMAGGAFGTGDGGLAIGAGAITMGLTGAVLGLLKALSVMRKAKPGDTDPYGEFTHALGRRPMSENLVRSMRELDKPGFGLELSVRNRLESFLGEDLSGVRLHTGLAAERLSESISADAFTLSEHVFLGAGQHLDTPEGMGVLAHEATHVVQHRQGRLAGPDTPARTQTLETEAYAHEHAFVAQALPKPPSLQQAPAQVLREAPPTSEDIPDTLPAPQTKLLRADAGRKRTRADIVEQVMEDFHVTSLTREEFLEELRERLIDLIHDEAEYDNERRETLAWNYNLPQA